MENSKETNLVKIFIAKDGNPENAKVEQFRYYQKDGVTVQVAIGKTQIVPRWVADIAKEVGDIDEIFDAKDRSAAGINAPACGLYFISADYAKDAD